MPYCRCCGSSVNLDDVFCFACGKPATNVPANTVPAAVVPAVVVPAAVVLPQPPPPAAVPTIAPAYVVPSQPPAAIPVSQATPTGGWRKRPAGVIALAVLSSIVTLVAGGACLWYLSIQATISTATSNPLAQLLFNLIPFLGQAKAGFMHDTT